MDNKIFIGDNLKLLNDTRLSEYVNNVSLIYIDPPYNNGSFFSFNNNKSKLDWINFMRERIIASYKFLKENSAIFISIDDDELAELKILLDSIFKKENFVGIFITKQAQRSNAKHINIVHEYIICYAKNKKKLPEFKINRIDIPEDKLMIDALYLTVSKEIKCAGIKSANKLLKKLIKDNCLNNNITWLKNYNNVDENGKIYFAKDLSTPSKPRAVNIPSIGLHLNPLATRGWPSDKKIINYFNNNRLVYKNNRPYVKHYLEESQDSAPSILNFYSRQGSNALKKLGINKIFDTPKPVELIKFLIRLYCKKNDIIMDYFAGSGTTAQAIYEINSEDNANLKYILIQLDEPVNIKSTVYKECLKLNIKPKLQYILKYRIDKFLTLAQQDINYDFYDK